MSEMICHLCYTRVSSYRLTDHMKEIHFQDRTFLTPLEMADLETIAARTDVDIFRRAIRFFVTSLVIGAAMILLGGILASAFPVHQIFNGWDYPSAPTYAVVMIWIGGAFGVIGTAGIVWFLSWAMRKGIWARYQAVQQRWLQLQTKESSG
jgi:hypothetical protein